MRAALSVRESICRAAALSCPGILKPAVPFRAMPVPLPIRRQKKTCQKNLSSPDMMLYSGRYAGLAARGLTEPLQVICGERYFRRP